jgi:hypothetical protein
MTALTAVAKVNTRRRRTTPASHPGPFVLAPQDGRRPSRALDPRQLVDALLRADEFIGLPPFGPDSLLDLIRTVPRLRDEEPLSGLYLGLHVPALASANR